MVFTIVHHLHSSGAGAAGSDSNQDETTANVGNNTTVINVNTKDSDNDNDNNINFNNSLYTSAPFHSTYPVTEQAYVSKGKSKFVNSVNTPQVPSAACTVWSKFQKDPVKNNLS